MVRNTPALDTQRSIGGGTWLEIGCCPKSLIAKALHGCTEASVLPRRNILDAFYADVSCGSALAKGTIQSAKKGAFARGSCD